LPGGEREGDFELLEKARGAVELVREEDKT